MINQLGPVTFHVTVQVFIKSELKVGVIYVKEGKQKKDILKQEINSRDSSTFYFHFVKLNVHSEQKKLPLSFKIKIKNSLDLFLVQEFYIDIFKLFNDMEFFVSMIKFLKSISHSRMLLINIIIRRKFTYHFLSEFFNTYKFGKLYKVWVEI